MRICFTSDTHNLHRRLDVPQCDILIHCGDFSDYGKPHEIDAFNCWVRDLKLMRRIKKCYLIPGNHDMSLEEPPGYGYHHAYENAMALLSELDGIWFNAGTVIDGIKFWGFCYIPPCGGNWSFQRSEDDLARRLELPAREANIDVFVSHAPPYDVSDVDLRLRKRGSVAIRAAIETINPRYSFFGHIHGNSEVSKLGQTTCCNVASDVGYDIKELRAPIILEISPK